VTRRRAPAAAPRPPALADPEDPGWVLSVHLSEADMRAVAAGTLPAWLPTEAARALVWFDEGIAAGLRQAADDRRRAELEAAADGGTISAGARG
jgi:hypothetical protein